MNPQEIPQLPDLPCYLNGEFSSVRDAKVSVMDRGFIFGDGVYEVVPAYAGRPFRFAEHMARLDRSLAEMRITNPMDPARWRELVDRLIALHAASQDHVPHGNNLICHAEGAFQRSSSRRASADRGSDIAR